MLDIRQRAAVTVLTFDLLGPDDAPLIDPATGKPCTATIHGPGSRKYIAAQAQRQAVLMAKIQKGKAPTLTADETLRQTADFLTAITESIELDYTSDDGNPLQGRDKLMAIYGDPALGYIAEQVQKKAGDWANFSKGSATS